MSFLPNPVFDLNSELLLKFKESNERISFLGTWGRVYMGRDPSNVHKILS